MRRINYRYQRTLAHAAEVHGIGFLTGANITARFLPAPPNTGIVFVRTDLGPKSQIPATVDFVVGTSRRTTLGRGTVTVALVEHVMAALAGLRIDNCHVEVNAPELPGLDGSAQSFVDVLLHAGTRLQPGRRAIYMVEEPVIVGHGDATLAIHPTGGESLRITYLLDYGDFSPLGRQSHTQTVTPESFANDLAGCRTFLLEEEALELRRQGIGSRTKPTDLLVFGKDGPLDNALRFANEPARHKMLDVVGDLALLGHDLRGHIVAYRSGHPLNVALTRILASQLSVQRQRLLCAA